VRITAKTERSANTDINGDGIIDAVTPVYYDGAYQFLQGAAGRFGQQVFTLTSLAVMPNGGKRIVQSEVSSPPGVPVDAAIHTLLSQVMGDALNVTGFTDPSCTAPSTPGAVSGQTVTVPGQGNVTGTPTGTVNNAPFPYNLPGIINSFSSQSKPIDSPGTGVTGSGSPASYTGPHATLGVPPTVTYDGSGAITAITSPGTPAIYTSPGNLTLGTSVKGGAPVTGQGVLLVQGNLSIDITNGFNYFGLVVVTGDISMTANPSTSASSNVHGAIVGGGKFNSNLANLSGSISIHQNACLVNNVADVLPRVVLAFREITQ
jgi:hypothetical protein